MLEEEPEDMLEEEPEDMLEEELVFTINIPVLAEEELIEIDCFHSGHSLLTLSQLLVAIAQKESFSLLFFALDILISLPCSLFGGTSPHQICARFVPTFL